MSEPKETGGYFALGAMLGAAVGAALGLLYAPRPGSETRQDLTSRSEELRQRAQELGSDLEARSGDALERARAMGSPDSPEDVAPEPDLPPGEDLL